MNHTSLFPISSLIESCDPKTVAPEMMLNFVDIFSIKLISTLYNIKKNIISQVLNTSNRLHWKNQYKFQLDGWLFNPYCAFKSLN